MLMYVFDTHLLPVTLPSVNRPPKTYIVSFLYIYSSNIKLPFRYICLAKNMSQF